MEKQIMQLKTKSEQAQLYSTSDKVEIFKRQTSIQQGRVTVVYAHGAQALNYVRQTLDLNTRAVKDLTTFINGLIIQAKKIKETLRLKCTIDHMGVRDINGISFFCSMIESRPSCVLDRHATTEVHHNHFYFI